MERVFFLNSPWAFLVFYAPLIFKEAYFVVRTVPNAGRVGVSIAPTGPVRLSVCLSEDASRPPSPSRACRSTAFCLQVNPEGLRSNRAAALTGSWIREERRAERRTEEGRNNTQGGEAKERKASLSRSHPFRKKAASWLCDRMYERHPRRETLLFCCLNETVNFRPRCFVLPSCCRRCC